MLISEVREWIEGDRGLWHAVVRKEYDNRTYFITACGRTEVDGLVEDASPKRVRSLPAQPAAKHRGKVWEPSQGSHYRVCGKCRRALAALAAVAPSVIRR